MSTIPFCIVCQKFGHEARGFKSGALECPARVIRLQADYGDPGTRREEEGLPMFNMHLHCNCGGYDSAHGASCPRYGHDARCDSCYVREQAGIDGPCGNCRNERVTRPTLRIKPMAPQMPVDRLVLKMTVNFMLDGARYDACTEQQLALIVAEMESRVRLLTDTLSFEVFGVKVNVKKEL